MEVETRYIYSIHTSVFSLKHACVCRNYILSKTETKSHKLEYV